MSFAVALPSTGLMAQAVAVATPLAAATPLALVMPLLLVIANVFGAGMIVPQVIRLRRTRSLDGLSAPWIGVGIAMNLWWIVYALPNQLWGLLPVSTTAAVLYCVMAWNFLRLAGPVGWRPLVVGAVSIGSIPMIALVLGGLPAAGLAIGLAYGAQSAPAVVTAVRANDTNAISSGTWTMGFLEAIIWLVYGLTIGDGALVVGGSGSMIMAGVIMARLIGVPRRSTPQTPLDRSLRGEVPASSTSGSSRPS